MNQPQLISFNYNRKFGVEIELNSFDRRNFKLNPLRKGESPIGSSYIANLITNTLKQRVDINRWGNNHNNSTWIVKPDSSCGIEVCSKVYKGWIGLKEICKVVDVFSKDPNVLIDKRCSLHVHIDVSDCSILQVATILSYWIKCEHLFMDSVPSHRKNNSYCQFIGSSPVFQHGDNLSARELISKLDNKYYSVNAYHYARNSRKTIEFRIGDQFGCRDPIMVKNWVKLLVHFVEITKNLNYPRMNDLNDPWSGLLWLDPKDIFRLLMFSEEYELSSGMQQVRNWFLARIAVNTKSTLDLWSDPARRAAKEEIMQIINDLGLDVENLYLELFPGNNFEMVFSEQLAR